MTGEKEKNHKIVVVKYIPSAGKKSWMGRYNYYEGGYKRNIKTVEYVREIMPLSQFFEIDVSFFKPVRTYPYPGVGFRCSHCGDSSERTKEIRYIVSSCIEEIKNQIPLTRTSKTCSC